MVQGEECKENIDWLAKSIVAEATKPIDFHRLTEWLPQVWRGVSSIRELGALMALVSFASEDAMNDAMKYGVDPVINFFFEIRLWSEVEWSFSRCVWLECRGLSPLAWSLSNLRRIG